MTFDETVKLLHGEVQPCASSPASGGQPWRYARFKLILVDNDADTHPDRAAFFRYLAHMRDTVGAI